MSPPIYNINTLFLICFIDNLLLPLQALEKKKHTDGGWVYNSFCGVFLKNRIATKKWTGYHKCAGKMVSAPRHKKNKIGQ